LDVLGIWNRGLQMLGAKAVASLTENSVNARACQTCYDSLRQSELRGHYWNFARKRAIIAASATPPLFDRTNAFALPPDFLMLVPPDWDRNFFGRQWQIEGGFICCDDDAPLHVIYIADITDTTLMDALFREMLAAKMGEQMSEQLTQSNSKIAACNANYKTAEARAKKANAFENNPADAPLDLYITTRM
jgi:hypothetical protein